MLGVLGPEHMSEGMGPLPDGSVLLSVYERRPPDAPRPEGLFRPGLGYFRVSADASRVDTLGWYGGIEQMFVDAGGRPTPVTALFSPHARTAVGGDPLRIFTGDSERVDVRVFAEDGTLERVIRWDRPPRRPTEEELDVARRTRLEWGESVGRRAEIERGLAALPPQEALPAFGAMVADLEGNLWLEEYRGPLDEEVRWHIFDPEGRLLGAVELPKELRLTEVGPDYLLAVARDELDVPSVELYELIR